MRSAGGKRRSPLSLRRASTQAGCPSDDARIISSASDGVDQACLLPVASGDPDQARVVRLVRPGVLQGPQALEQAPDLVVDEPLVDDAAQRAELVGPRGDPAGGMVTR